VSPRAPTLGGGGSDLNVEYHKIFLEFDLFYAKMLISKKNLPLVTPFRSPYFGSYPKIQTLPPYIFSPRKLREEIDLLKTG
jgi:hypothetical protein